MPSLPTALAAALVALLTGSVAAQDDPQSWRLAMGYLQRGLHDQAAEQLRSFLEERPRDRRVAEARYRLGVCELELGRTDRGIAELERAAAADRSFALRPECLYRLAGALQRAKRPDDARRRFEELIGEIGEQHYLAAAAHFGAGEGARDAGDERAAAAHFLTAADRAGADDPAGYRFAGLYQAGYALLRADAPADAATAFGVLAERFVQHEARGEVLHLLAESHSRAGNAAIAEAAWTQSAAVGGEFADDARSGLAWSRRQRGDLAGALAAFRDLAKRHPDSTLTPPARLEIGRILLQQGDAAGAGRAVAELLDDRGAPPELRRAALEVQGLALLEVDDVDAARAALVRAAADAPPADVARLRYAIAECDAAAGRFVEALSGYDASVQTEDAALRGDALYGRVIALHTLGRHDESMRSAEQLIRSAGDHRLAPYAAFAIAENLFALERYADALQRFDTLGADHPLAADARAKAAWSAWLAGDAAQAQRRFRRLADDAAQSAAQRDESLSMAALAAFTAGDAAAALDLADTYRARHPAGANLARTERVAARVLRDRGEIAAASERLATAARADQGSESGAAVAMERAELLFQSGDFGAAAKAFTAQAGRNDAVGARAIEALAWCSFELGDDAACRRWIEAGVSHPAAGDIAAGLRELRVTVAHRGEDWAAARQAAEEFLEAHPRHARAGEVRYALAVAVARAGDPQAARTILEPLARDGGVSRPDLVLYELGWACKNTGDGATARRRFAQAAELASDPELGDECRVRAAEVDLENDRRAAARELLEVVRHPVYRGRAGYLLAQSWVADEQLDDAIAAFDAVVALGRPEPLYADALFASGETAHRAGRHADGVARLTRFVGLDASQTRAIRARLLLGECLVHEGRPADAIGQLAAFVDGADDEPDAVRARGYLWLGRAHQARDQHRDAEAAFAQAAELSQGDIAAEAWYRTGETRRANGDLHGAADAFVRVTILYAHDEWVPRALLEAGRCFDQLGQEAQARRLWSELVERYGDTDEAKAVRQRLRGGDR